MSSECLSVSAVMLRSGTLCSLFHCLFQWNLQSKQTWWTKCLQVCELHSNTLTWSWKEAGYATQQLHLWSEQDWSPAGLYITDWQLMEGVSVNTHVSLLLSLFSLSESDWWGRWRCWEDQLCPDDPERLKQHHQLVDGEALTGQRGELHPAVTDGPFHQLEMTVSAAVWTALRSAPLISSTVTSSSLCWGS